MTNNPGTQNRYRPYPSKSIFTIAPARITTPEAADLVDQEKELRNQIHMEIEKKSKVCSNPLYECTLPRLEHYNYCLRHILQDPRAPYKQCAFFFASNGKRCLEPAPKYENKKEYGTNYCFEHSRLTQLTRTKSAVGKLTPIETTETLLHNLAHHVKVDKSKQSANCSALKITVHEDDEEEELDIVTPSVDPYSEYLQDCV